MGSSPPTVFGYSRGRDKLLDALLDYGQSANFSIEFADRVRYFLGIIRRQIDARVQDPGNSAQPVKGLFKVLLSELRIDQDLVCIVDGTLFKKVEWDAIDGSQDTRTLVTPCDGLLLCNGVADILVWEMAVEDDSCSGYDLEPWYTNGLLIHEDDVKGLQGGCASESIVEPSRKKSRIVEKEKGQKQLEDERELLKDRKN